jgi:hypothetical protein
MYIGMDLSLCNSGICVIDSNGKILQNFGIKTKATKEDLRSRYERYHFILDQLKHEMSFTKWKNIKCIAIENYSYGSQGKIVQLVESGTIIRDYLFFNLSKYISFIEVAPISLKKFILGTVKNKGKEAKNIMCREVYKKYKVDIDDDNQIDSFLLANVAKCFYEIQNHIEGSFYYNYQLEVVNNLLKKVKK